MSTHEDRMGWNGTDRWDAAQAEMGREWDSAQAWHKANPTEPPVLSSNPSREEVAYSAARSLYDMLTSYPPEQFSAEAERAQWAYVVELGKRAEVAKRRRHGERV